MITGYWKDSKDAGSCINCSKHYNDRGSIPHKVLVITFNADGNCGQVIRLCSDCLLDLHELLFGKLRREGKR